MKNIFLSLLLICVQYFTCSVAFAQRMQGYDALALAKYCDVYLKSPRLPAVSTLLNTFDDPLPCIEKAIRRGGIELVQIDLIDATCWRNRVCPAGVPKPDDLGAISKRAQNVNNFALRFPQVEWWISPSLEHDIKDRNKVQQMMNAAQKGCPVCKIINSPFSGARNEPFELHGTKVRAFAVSGDGASSFDSDTLESDNNGFNHAKSGSDQTYMWFNELNLRCTGEKKFTPPLQRTERPTVWQFRQAYLITQKEQPKPQAPSQCKKVLELKSPEIYKPNAESYCNGVPKDSRSNKPLLILKKSGKRGDKIKVLSKSGKEVGCFMYYGDFEKGLHRWYMGNCSGQNPVELYDALGGEWGFVQLNKDTCLLTNSVRRLGVYR